MIYDLDLVYETSTATHRVEADSPDKAIDYLIALGVAQPISIYIRTVD